MSSKHHERREQGEKPRPTAGPEPDKAQVGAEAAPPAGAEVGQEVEALRARAASLEASVAALTEENSSLKDQYLRKLADYENFRKRMFREKDESLKYALTGLLGDLVPVLDDFDRAVASSEHAKDYRILHDGVILIRRQLGSLLENKYGLKRFESVGQPFDPNIHEALSMESGDQHEPTVSEEYLPGYRLHDRVVRSAKVRVRMPSPSAASPAAPSEAPEATGAPSSAAPEAGAAQGREGGPEADAASGGAEAIQQSR